MPHPYVQLRGALCAIEELSVFVCNSIISFALKNGISSRLMSHWEWVCNNPSPVNFSSHTTRTIVEEEIANDFFFVCVCVWRFLFAIGYRAMETTVAQR